MGNATDALLQPNLQIAEEVIDRYADITHHCTKLESDAFTILARQAPVAGDLRAVVSTLKDVADIHRMGALATHVAQIARRRHLDIAVPADVVPYFELRDGGVGVGTAHPTFFPTPMMEHIHADPAASAVWGGNKRGLWKMVPLNVVVDAIIDGIEKRSDLIVAPKSLALPARIPGIVRPIVDRLGFPGTTIRDAIALAAARVEMRPALKANS